jgi:hypothetical protein
MAQVMRSGGASAAGVDAHQCCDARLCSNFTIPMRLIAERQAREEN